MLLSVAPETLADFLYDGLMLVFWLVVPALGAAVGAAMVTSLVQSSMQVQEPALSFVPKLLAVGVALTVSATALRDRWLAFAQELFSAIG